MRTVKVSLEKDGYILSKEIKTDLFTTKVLNMVKEVSPLFTIKATRVFNPSGSGGTLEELLFWAKGLNDLIAKF